jgi:hypothetical protein
MRLEDRLMRDGLGFGPAVEAIKGGRALKLLGQGASRVLDDQVGGVNQPPCPAVVAKLSGPEMDLTEAGRIGSGERQRFFLTKSSMLMELRL